MPAPFYPNSSAIDQAATMQTDLALSVVKLFKDGFAPNATTTVAELDAQEADYTTYAAKTITAWGDPILSSAGGAQITAPTVQFTLAADPAVGNAIGGYWIEKAGGEVVLIRQFDTPVAMTAANQGITLTPTLIFPNGG